MGGFVKLHSSIEGSSIMDQDVHVRFVWLMMLAFTDNDGIVYGTPQSLARRMNIPLEQFNHAMQVLMSPDPNSGRSEEDGRRIVSCVVDGRGHHWRVVNYHYYRQLRNYEDRKEYMKEYMRERRSGEKASDSLACKQTVNNCKPSMPIGEGEGEGDTPPISSPSGRTRFAPPTVDEVRAHVTEKGYHFDPEAFVAYYESKGWKVGNSPMRSWKSACVTWEKRREQDAKPKQKRIYRGQDHAEFNPKF